MGIVLADAQLACHMAAEFLVPLLGCPAFFGRQLELGQHRDDKLFPLLAFMALVQRLEDQAETLLVLDLLIHYVPSG